MQQQKTIFDYFNDTIEYPKEVAHNPLPYGVVWLYISSTFLNAFVNYVKPISWFVLSRYTADDQDISGKKIHLCNKGEFGKWYNWEGTKKQLINGIIGDEIEMYHNDLYCFEDDIILLAEIENNENDGTNKYMFFWFDCDVSDCCIGRFKTTDTKEEVTQSIRNYLEKEKHSNKNEIIEDGLDNGVIDYVELPVSFLRGWLSF